MAKYLQVIKIKTEMVKWLVKVNDRLEFLNLTGKMVLDFMLPS